MDIFPGEHEVYEDNIRIMENIRYPLLQSEPFSITDILKKRRLYGCDCAHAKTTRPAPGGSGRWPCCIDPSWIWKIIILFSFSILDPVVILRIQLQFHIGIRTSFVVAQLTYDLDV